MFYNWLIPFNDYMNPTFDKSFIMKERAMSAKKQIFWEADQG